MNPTRIGFIGGGRVAAILLGGWQRAQAMPAAVAVCDPDPAALERLRTRYPSIEPCGADPARPAASDVVFLAVHPPAIKDSLAAVKPALRRDAVLVSLAPKFTVAKLSESLGGFGRIARVIPNAPSIVGRGYNPVAFGPELGEAERGAVRRLLAPLGEAPEVPEPELEIMAIVAAMGPTYLWPQLYALAELARGWGMSDARALEAIDAMARGTAATMRESGLAPEQVMDLIPVKPLADDVAALLGAYRTKLQGLFEKIKP